MTKLEEARARTKVQVHRQLGLEEWGKKVIAIAKNHAWLNVDTLAFGIS